jgi:hypothetical protein
MTSISSGRGVALLSYPEHNSWLRTPRRKEERIRTEARESGSLVRVNTGLEVLNGLSRSLARQLPEISRADKGVSRSSRAPPLPTPAAADLTHPPTSHRTPSTLPPRSHQHPGNGLHLAVSSRGFLFFTPFFALRLASYLPSRSFGSSILSTINKNYVRLVISGCAPFVIRAGWTARR